MLGSAADSCPVRRIVALACLAAALLAAPAHASDARARLLDGLGEQGFVRTLPRTGGISHLGRTDGFLTGPSADDPAVIALRYVRANLEAFGLDADDLAGLRLTERYTSIDGVTHVFWAQHVAGIPAYRQHLGAHVTADGRLIGVMGAPAGDLDLESATPELSAARALVSARLVAGGSVVAPRGPRDSAELVVFRRGGEDVLAWRIETLGAEGTAHEVVVDAATAATLSYRPLTFSANQALIWDHHPDATKTPRAVDLGADPTWIDRSEGGTKLQGNNAYAHSWLQFTGDPVDVPQVGGNWSFPIQFLHHAECGSIGCTWDSSNHFGTRHLNRAQAATQAFYYVNLFHDHLLAPPIGFDEASRNYEFTNASGQGLGGDPIDVTTGRAGALINNASFTYAPDGSVAYMVLGLADAPRDLNTADSAEIVYHEYAHGLHGRLVGAGIGPLLRAQTRALGEGWADWYALDYVVGQGFVADAAAPGDLVYNSYIEGMRRTEASDCTVGASAAVCPGAGTAGSGGYTFGDLGRIDSTEPAEEHANGEIWTQTLWDLRRKVGVANARALVTGGMRLSPDDPTFLEARDAILQTALVLGLTQTPIWQVFAARGMGENASTPGNNSVVTVEDFTYPGAPPPDTTRPDTRITARPAATTTMRKATFRFSSTETGSTFQCKLDARAWASCKSPKTYTGLAKGRHTFRVRAKDRAGNVDASPATRTWRIR